MQHTGPDLEEEYKMNFMSENENENITPVTEEMPEAVQYDEEEENSGDTEYPEYDEDETEEQVIPKKKEFFLAS